MSAGNALAVALSLAGGIAVGVQVAVNGQLGKRVGVLPTFAFSVTVTVAIAVVVLLAAHQSLRGYAHVVQQPWWLWLGGVMGAIAVLGITYSGPRIGTFATIGLIVAGQLGVAVLIDRFGLFGLERIPVHWPRLVAIGLLAAGSVLALRK
jgi:transporter family-2 protein